MKQAHAEMFPLELYARMQEMAYVVGRYGRHDEDCARCWGEDVCTCGFEAAKERLGL